MNDALVRAVREAVSSALIEADKADDRNGFVSYTPIKWIFAPSGFRAVKSTSHLLPLL